MTALSTERRTVIVVTKAPGLRYLWIDVRAMSGVFDRVILIELRSQDTELDQIFEKSQVPLTAGNIWAL